MTGEPHVQLSWTAGPVKTKYLRITSQNIIVLSIAQVELHAARLPKSWGNRTAAFSHFFGEMAKQQYRVANHEVNYRKVDWYTQFKTVRCGRASAQPRCPCVILSQLPLHRCRHCPYGLPFRARRPAWSDSSCCSHGGSRSFPSVELRTCRAQNVPIPSMAEYTFVKVNSRGQVITGPDLL